MVTLGGVDLSTLGIKVIKGTKVPGLSNTRDNYMVIGNRHGVIDYGAEMSELHIQLNCVMHFSSTADYESKLTKLRKIFMDYSGRPKYVELVFGSSPNRAYDVRYTGDFDINKMAKTAFFTLTLMAKNPFIRSKALKTYTTSLSGSGIRSASLVLPNQGDIDVYPIIEVRGSYKTVSFQIQNRRDGTGPQDRMTYTVNSTVHGDLSIDCENMTCVYADGQYNTLSFLSGEFQYVLASPSGPYSNLLITSTDPNITVTVKFYERFL